MIGILGCIGFSVAGLVIAAAGFSLSVYSTIEQSEQLDRQKDKADKEAARQERKAAVYSLQQFKETMNVHNRGLLTAKSELLKKEREQASYGSPARPA